MTQGTPYRLIATRQTIDELVSIMGRLLPLLRKARYMCTPGNPPPHTRPLAQSNFELIYNQPCGLL